MLTNRAQVYRQFGQALDDLNRAIELNPDLAASRINRGAIYYSSEEFEHALGDFDQCIAIDPHTAAPEPNHLFPMLFQSLISAFSRGGSSPINEYSAGDARSR
jgi:tetratricopeptide (TPR) repeat protein